MLHKCPYKKCKASFERAETLVAHKRLEHSKKVLIIISFYRFFYNNKIISLW